MSSRLALGTVQFGIPYGVANRSGQVSSEEAAAILAHAWSVGMDTLDTAIAYGESEQRLGEIGVRQWRVVSKLPLVPEQCADIAGWVRSEVDGSLKRLGISSLYGLLLHHPRQLTGPDGNAIWLALSALKDRRLVEKIGVSIYGPTELDTLWPSFRPDIVQSPFSIVDQRLAASGWMNRLSAAGTEVHVRSVFLQGLLLMDAGARPAKFDAWRPLWQRWHDWLVEAKLTAVQACLGFALSHAQVHRLVLGVDSLRQLREIVAGASGGGITPPASLVSEDPALIDPSRWNMLT